MARKQLTLPDRQPAKRKACSITEDQALAKRLADEGTGAARKQAKTTNSCQTNAGNKTVGVKKQKTVAAGMLAGAHVRAWARTHRNTYNSTHARTHMHNRTCAHAYTHTCTHTYRHVRTHTRVHTYTRTHVRAHTHAHACTLALPHTLLQPRAVRSRRSKQFRSPHS